VVALSVARELVGAAPAPPPLTRILLFRIAEEVSAVVLLKYGIPPLVVVPLTVRGNDKDALPHPEQDETVSAPGTFIAPVLGLRVKLATVAGACEPDVLAAVRIEKAELVVLAAVVTVAALPV
jgi:hypothetical protein